MAKEPKSTAQLEQEVSSLRAAVNDAQRTITQMQKLGGFADSKTLSQRSTRLEKRVEVLESDLTMHKDISAHLIELLARHLGERHDVDIDTSTQPDVIFYRKIRKRWAEWKEAREPVARRRTDQENSTRSVSAN